MLITGSVITESVFAGRVPGSWCGCGQSQGFQVVQAIVIVFAAVFTMTNLAVDILYAYIDPRIRYQ